MKKVLLVLLLLPLFAGTQTNLDSLWQVWENEDFPDTTRLKAMQKYTWDGYLFANPDSAFYFAEQGFQFAKKRI